MKLQRQAFFEDPTRACAGVGSEVFFPPEDTQPKTLGRWDSRPAKSLCRICPVIDDCRAYALDNNIQFGVWGGMSPQDRSRLRKLRRKEAS